MAVLMGANTRTYKFALGAALLDLAGQGRDEVRLSELAVPYAVSLVAHLADAPQAPADSAVSDTDFLTVAKGESEESMALGQPTERLLEAAQRSIPIMVMQKFHNLRGSTELPHRFYELVRDRRGTIVRLTPALRQVVFSEHAPSLRTELAARWNIVESSFAVGVGRTLMTEGVAVDLDRLVLTDKRRRRSVAGVTDAVIGFQHGRCLICGQTIAADAKVAADHVFPYALMRRFSGVGVWAGPDLDQLWNLAPAHATCNSDKSDRPPTPPELDLLAQRNEAIMQSPHPLRKTLQLSLRQAGYDSPSGQWPDFLRQVQAAYPPIKAKD
ncbi:HNH endonuclease [Kibdelosporangium aridum]|uniref:HNH endonuclease n=2 Tax=Kibdelosporangium aridum TaxID=2030 RepID=A0A428ZEG1_KIBAR|nr:HNH endonuclease [Kibdelosporangium aridum]